MNIDGSVVVLRLRVKPKIGMAILFMVGGFFPPEQESEEWMYIKALGKNKEQLQKIRQLQITIRWRYRMKNTEIRFANENDVALILDFIKDLAEYEKMSDQVVAGEALLREWIFEKKKAEVIFAMEDGKEVGFALFFHNFSTFLGRAGIYLEDLYVKPDYRGHGHGTALIKKLASIACERGCGRLEWSCLDWNTPSIDFYISLGAKQMNEWTVYRFEGEKLVALAQKE